MQCDLCGKEAPLFRAVVEGVELNACQVCSRFGKKLGHLSKPRAVETKRTIKREPLELVETIVPDFAQKIKTAREKMGMKQEDFAKKLNEKTSIIHKIETGSFAPPMPLAKKLQ